MLDATFLASVDGSKGWPQTPVHVHVTGFGDGALVSVDWLRQVAGVRLVGSDEVHEFQLAAVKYISFDGASS